MHLYFSQAPHPNDVDPDQLKALRQFRDQLGGLAGQFTTADELKDLVWQANFDLGSLDPVDEPTQASSVGIRFFAQSGSERLLKTDSHGRLKHETKRWVDLTNQGEIDAEHVKVEPAESQTIWMYGGNETTIHAGQTRRYPFTFSMVSPHQTRRFASPGTTVNHTSRYLISGESSRTSRSRPATGTRCRRGQRRGSWLGFRNGDARGHACDLGCGHRCRIAGPTSRQRRGPP